MFAVTLLISVIAVIYVCFKWRYKYWQRKGVPYIQPVIPFGNWENFFNLKRCNGEIFRGFYEEFKKRGSIHGGIFVLYAPVYVPVDKDVIKRILSTDFHHFTDKDFYINEKDQPITAHLFAIGGEKWRVLRQKLTPTFTSGKMKMMLNTLIQCRLPLLEHLHESAMGKLSINAREIAALFTTDVIGSVAFGIDCNSFKNPNSDFIRYGRGVFKATPYRMIKSLFKFAFPDFSKKLGLLMFEKDVENFFNRIVIETIEYRERNNVTRNDFMQLLIDLKNAEVENRITLDELIAQAFVFFVAGFETSSTTISFCLFELAQHQDIQDKVRDEINEVLRRYDGEVTYEALGELVYMKQVIDETLRKYPPLPTIDRKCVKDYNVPGTDVIIEAGTSITISSHGLHRDPEYYPDPEMFDPNRFSKKNVSKIPPFTYIPFGEGPRMCIGLRFGLMQTKVALVSLLQNYRYTLNEKTSPRMEYNLSFILTPKGDILLDVAELN